MGAITVALLLLTSVNIEYTKSALRSVFPHVKATHRAEALAAGLCFRTYASLLATLKRDEMARCTVGFIDLARFSTRLQELGYHTVDPSSLIAIARSPAMPLRPWAEYKNGDRVANYRWFRECQRRDIPDIYIETRAKYVRLNWDCISRDPKHDTHLGEDQGANLVRKMFARFQALTRHRSGKAMFEGSSFVGFVDHLLPDVARDIADEFYTMLTVPPAQKMAA
ncbi:hypothetical protein RPC_3923 [Rhodopseudomonas palustris BisB18]|uniref:Uncharacterized protein n=1 Tax=Rhodopseudomonas palustris (strain BisB18) TaxID=316056 RepID=Q20ZI7_RHOPB